MNTIRLPRLVWVLALLAVAPTLAHAVPLTRAQALAALLNPGSGVTIDTGEVGVWSPYFDFGSGAGREGLVPSGTVVDPALLSTQPYPGPGMTATTASYFFFIEDNPVTIYSHATRFILLDANAVAPTVGNGGIAVSTQGWWPVVKVPSNPDRKFFSTELARTSLLPPGPTNPDGWVAGLAESTSVTDTQYVGFKPGYAEATEANKACALAFAGQGDGMFESDVAQFTRDMRDLDGVSVGRIRVVNGGKAGTKNQLRDGVKNLCAYNPPCDKIYVLISSHGSKGGLKVEAANGNPEIMSADTLCSIMSLLAAKNVPICMLISSCFSGSLLDPANWGFPKGSVIITSTDANHEGTGGPIKGERFPRTLFTDAISKCRHDLANQHPPKPHGLADGFHWVKLKHPCYEMAIVRDKKASRMFYPAGPPPDSPGVDPGPTEHNVARLAGPGDPLAFSTLDSVPTMQVQFVADPSGFSTSSASVYCSTSASGWTLIKHWNWNAGLTRAFTPDIAGAKYELVVHANNYPVVGSVIYGIQDSDQPSSQMTLPAYSLGWLDASHAEFNSALGLGGGPLVNLFIQPGGTLLNQAPAYLGANHSAGIQVSFGLQPDFSRPWLYIGNNPNQRFTGPSYLILRSDGITDAAGVPVASLPLVVELFQGATHLTMNVQASDIGGGRISVPAVSLGQLLPQPFSVKVTVANAPAKPNATAVAAGIFSMDALSVLTRTTGTTRIDLPPMPGAVVQLSAAAPNPSRTASRMQLALGEAAKVRAVVYDASGRRVRTIADAQFEPGNHDLTWDGRDNALRPVSSGVYLARVEVDGKALIRRIVRLR